MAQQNKTRGKASKWWRSVAAAWRIGDSVISNETAAW